MQVFSMAGVTDRHSVSGDSPQPFDKDYRCHNYIGHNSPQPFDKDYGCAQEGAGGRAGVAGPTDRWMVDRPLRRCQLPQDGWTDRQTG